MGLSLLISPLLWLIWWSDLIGKDRQQAPPSLTFAHPEQIAKLLIVD
jgi:hypothetical protein